MQFSRIAAASLPALLVAGAIGAGLVAAGAESKPPVPQVQIFGPQSQAPAGFHRIRDQQSWERLWAEHVGAESATIAGVSTAPAVDFARCEVVAFFRGAATNIRGEVVESLEPVEGGRRLRFDSSTYQTASFSGEDAGVDCAPFGFWIMDRDEGAITIEENVQNLIGGPPVWRQRTRLEAGQ
jgi:hypothetical protein